MTRTASMIRLALLLLCLAPAWGFSPYENYLLSGKPTHVGLLAKVKDGHKAELFDGLRALGGEDNVARLARAGLTDLGAWHREIGGATWVVVYFSQAGGRDYLDAARAFEAAAPAARELALWTEPHPRATRMGTHWLQMEWINFVRGRDLPGPPRSRLMIVTTIRPDKEQEYRSLHQTVWPGVVDQLARGNNRNLSIFLAAIDDLLVEFLYLEYVGDAPEEDEAMSQTDEINRRWWRLTDACQAPLPGVQGIWDLMTPVREDAADQP
jgi:L-rhamnose mutarotase